MKYFSPQTKNKVKSNKIIRILCSRSHELRRSSRAPAARCSAQAWAATRSLAQRRSCAPDRDQGQRRQRQSSTTARRSSLAHATDQCRAWLAAAHHHRRPSLAHDQLDRDRLERQGQDPLARCRRGSQQRRPSTTGQQQQTAGHDRVAPLPSPTRSDSDMNASATDPAAHHLQCRPVFGARTLSTRTHIVTPKLTCELRNAAKSDLPALQTRNMRVIRSVDRQQKPPTKNTTRRSHPSGPLGSAA